MSVRPEAAKILKSDEEFKAELKKRVGDAAVYVLADESKGNGEGNCFICKKEAPQMVSLTPDHQVACHLYTESAQK